MDGVGVGLSPVREDVPAQETSASATQQIPIRDLTTIGVLREIARDPTARVIANRPPVARKNAQNQRGARRLGARTAVGPGTARLYTLLTLGGRSLLGQRISYGKDAEEPARSPAP